MEDIPKNFKVIWEEYQKGKTTESAYLQTGVDFRMQQERQWLNNPQSFWRQNAMVYRSLRQSREGR